MWDFSIVIQIRASAVVPILIKKQNKTKQNKKQNKTKQKNKNKTTTTTTTTKKHSASPNLKTTAPVRQKMSDWCSGFQIWTSGVFSDQNRTLRLSESK